MSINSARKIVPLTSILHAHVQVPGSKSVAARALVCAALASEESVVSNLPSGDDTNAMLAGLSQLGAVIEVDGHTARIKESIQMNKHDPIVIDAKLAGTTARFLTAVAALRAGEVVITGEEALRKRPMNDLHQALCDIGSDVSPLNGAGALPVAVKYREQAQSRIVIPASTSSQFTSAMMMIAPMLPKGLTIAAEGEIVSGSYVDMTVAVQKRFGVFAQLVDANAYRYEPSRYVGCNYVVEPDASSASYPMAAVAIVGGSITIKDFALSSLQGDAKFLGVLENMGCGVEVRGDDIVVTRDSSQMLKGITVDMRDMSDLVPTLAVMASFASTPTTISGVGFIRKKESDRIGDLANEMRKLGARVDEHDDGLVIHPSEHHGGVVETHHDHRLAMSLALIGLAVEGVVISQPDVVSKSWPEYWSMLDSLK